MNDHPLTSRLPGALPRRAMSLIEMIGVLAVIAVLAAVGLPSLLRILDRIAREREEKVLFQLGDAFRNGVLRARQISDPSTWPSFIAREAGLDLTAVSQNPRRVQRAFLYDKSGWLGTSLPYAQTNSPAPSQCPTNARVMLVSSLGDALPADLNNTAMSAADFADLWNVPEDTVPGSGPWVGWTGRGDDVKIQRVNLAPLFVNLVLSTYTGTNLGLYRIDNAPAGTGYYSASSGAGVSGYFLKGTRLDLYGSAPSIALQHSVLLDQDTSYVYENGVWRSSILGAVAVAMGDASGIVEAFLKAPENINAANTNGAGLQQQIIVTNFIAYMSNYNRWEDGGFTDTALKAYIKDVLQPNMMEAVQGIYLYSGVGNNHYPTNDYMPCVPTVNP